MECEVTWGEKLLQCVKYVSPMTAKGPKRTMWVMEMFFVMMVVTQIHTT